MLRSALELANRAVYEQSQLSEDFTGMGTTLVAAFLSRDLAVIINVGDSRAYHLPGRRRLARHARPFHGRLHGRARRADTQEQAKLHPAKTSSPAPSAPGRRSRGDVFICKLRKEECILLCSDGLSNEMADQEMLFEVVHGMSKSDCCQRLLHIAKKRGAPDNVTVALAAV